jgi:hypothetical protein
MSGERPPRTRLEAEVHRLGQTAEEFSEYAETFARERGLSATLSPRHAQRLMAGQATDGQPLGPVRPATRRLLEAMFSQPIGELLGSPRPPTGDPRSHELETQLRAYLEAARGIDNTTVWLFQEKLNLTRVLDRRLGALGLLGELNALIGQVAATLRYALRPDVRTALSRVLVDCSTLAGWQSLDRGAPLVAWRHYDRAKSAAAETQSPELQAYAYAAQAVVLLDIGHTTSAVELTEHAVTIGKAAPPLLRSWLSAAHGEAHSAAGNRSGVRRAFAHASRLMPPELDPTQTPYIVFGPAHLARWHGGALAAVGDPEAVPILLNALDQLDPTFVRAETTLRVDLATVHSELGEDEPAHAHSVRARHLAQTIGSARQRNRLSALGL